MNLRIKGVENPWEEVSAVMRRGGKPRAIVHTVDGRRLVGDVMGFGQGWVQLMPYEDAVEGPPWTEKNCPFWLRMDAIVTWTIG